MVESEAQELTADLLTGELLQENVADPCGRLGFLQLGLLVQAPLGVVFTTLLTGSWASLVCCWIWGKLRIGGVCVGVGAKCNDRAQEFRSSEVGGRRKRGRELFGQKGDEVLVSKPGQDALALWKFFGLNDAEEKVCDGWGLQVTNELLNDGGPRLD